MPLSLNLLLRLLFAHILMDFLLQSSKMVQRKQKGTLQIQILSNLAHSALHAMASYLVVIFISHFSIDFFLKREGREKNKANNKKQDKSLNIFLLDQLLHISVLVILWLATTQQFGVISKWLTTLTDSNQIWKYLIAYLLVLSPMSILIKMFIKKWEHGVNKQKNVQQINVEEQGLNQAGQWIGYMERILVLTFVFLGYWAAIGFLLAAKSIFRYGNLKENQDIRMTEYVLIGTLSSFAAAILIGLLFR